MLRWGQLPTVVSRGSGRFRVCGNEMFYRTTLTCVRRFVVPPPPRRPFEVLLAVCRSPACRPEW